MGILTKKLWVLAEDVDCLHKRRARARKPKAIMARMFVWGEPIIAKSISTIAKGRPSSSSLASIDYVGTVPPNFGLTPGAPREPVAASASSGAITPTKGRYDGSPKIWAADLRLIPDGRCLQATERTKNHIGLLSVAPDTGKAAYVRNYEAEAQAPSIQISSAGNFLVAWGQKSIRLLTYRIDRKTGALTLAGRTPVGRDANWIEIATCR